MTASGRANNATRVLVRHLESADRGRITTGRGLQKLEIYVQNGQILAAEAGDDNRHLLRRLKVAQLITASRAQELLAMAELGEPIFGHLLAEVPGDDLDAALRDRFVENIVRFVGTNTKRLKFEELPAIFVDNIQMGDDPQDLLHDGVQLWRAASSVDVDTEVKPGPETPTDHKQEQILLQLGDGAPVVTLLSQLPLEPLTARATIASMLRSGVLVPLHEDDTIETPHLTATDDDDIELDDPSTDIAEDDIEPPTEEVARAPGAGAGDLTSLDAWMGHGIDLDEDMDAFGDFDSNRGSHAEVEDAPATGEFSTEAHNLDRVEVAEIDEAEVEVEEPIAVDEAPQANFSAPVLSADDAMGKIRVTNEVLHVIAGALDDTEGAGRGQSLVQLLVDGSPLTYADLFRSVRVDDDGGLGPDAIVRNLGHRPPTEHRRLLNQGLINLIDRALSSAADELPDEAIDSVLERVAGYRQRMGL